MHAMPEHGLDVVQDRCLWVDRRTLAAASAPGTR
jgi:hypothetical protein